MQSGAASHAGSFSGSFSELTHYAGFDWAMENHQVVVVDRAGAIVLQEKVEESAQGWQGLQSKLAALGKVGVAIETSCGPAVERLLAMGLVVFPLNPKAAERFRDRKAPSGVKDDTLDAWSFADALRTDGQAWRPLVAQDSHTQLLRMLCRDEIALIEQRTGLVLQLKQALYEYYPAALEAFCDWTSSAAWDLVLAFPTPLSLREAGKRRWQTFLHTHRLYQPEQVQRRLEIFARADRFANPSEAVTMARSLLAVTIAKQLRTLEGQLKEYRQRIEKLFADHPDSGLFGSLPGAGDKLAPRLLGELGTHRQVFESAQALQCYAGTAPVTRKSGKSRVVKIRWMCNKVLRATVHLWADQSRHGCAWAQAYYQQKRKQGASHAQGLRCLGQRWLKILWRMWQDRVCYDEALHMRNQTRHGSWVITLLPSSSPATTA